MTTRWVNDVGSCGEGSGSQVRLRRKEKRKKNAVNANNDGQESHSTGEEEGAEVTDVVAALDDNGEQMALERVRTIHDKLGHPGISRTLYFARR